VAAAGFALEIAGVEPSAWLIGLGGPRPSVLPAWPAEPGFVVAMVSTRLSESDGQPETAEVVVLCTREELRRRSVAEPHLRKLFFHIPKTKLVEAVPSLASAKFET
jgi:hypothetical protein